MRKAILAVAILAASGAGLYWHYGHAPQPAPAAGVAGAPAGGPGGPGGGPPPALPVEAAKVTIGPIAREIVAVGSLRSNESVMIRPEVAGRISKILFSEGQSVAKGEALVRLDDSTERAQLEEARATEALAQSNNQRANTLARQGAGTERARDEASSALRVAQAKVEVARAALEKKVIVAPFDGVVGLRAVSAGAYVQPGQDIVNLESLDPIKVDFRIPEVHLGSLKIGQTVAVTLDAYPGKSFTGQVYAIDPQIDINGRALAVRARIANPDTALRPGLFARLTLKVDEVQNAVTIPEQAIVPKGNEAMVFKVVDGKAAPTPVTLGKRAKGMVEVVSGLAPEDVVVTAGQMKIRPGAPVAVVQPAKQGGA